MDFLASPPDVQLDWNAMTMMVQEHDAHHSDFCHSRPNSSSSSSSPSSSSSSMSPFFDDPERWRFGQNAQLLPVLAAQKKSTTREMVFRMAAMQPVHAVGPESLEPPKRRRNVRISSDPQSTAARRRRERISERIRILQRLVPGGAKMDTASMLDEAVQYLKFLKSQVTIMERAGLGRGGGIVAAAAAATTTGSFSCSEKIEQVFDYEFVTNPMHLLS